MESVVNKFSNGMQSDWNKHFNDALSYLFGENISIRFNPDVTADPDAPLNGNTGSVMAPQGNTLVMTFCPGYIPVGFADSEKEIIVFLSNGINSEIGRLQTDGKTATYIPLFNDRFDPNGDRLNFSKEHRFVGQATSRNEKDYKVFFADGYNDDRVINIPSFYRDTELQQPYHTDTRCEPTNIEYPHWLSVHSFAQLCDCRHPTFVYRRDVGLGTGQGLLSGKFRYVMRYRTYEGYTTPFTIPTNDIQLSQLSKYDDPDNHHSYQMTASGLGTRKYIEYELRHLDTRFYEVEVYAIYQQTDAAIHSIYLINRHKLVPGQDAVILDHRSNFGAVMTVAELNQITVNHKSASIALQDNRQYKANLTFEKDPTIDTSAVTFEPIFYAIQADVTAEPTYASKDDPFTNSPLTNKGIPMVLSSGVTELYPIIDDRDNYKGTQVSHLLKGYPRGSSAEVLAVFGDRKGNFGFGQALGTVNFPQQFESAEAKLTNPDGSLRAMGFKVSGIRIPVKELYNERGELKVSYMSIVRGQIQSDVVCQGMILNTMAMVPNPQTGRNPKMDNTTFPLALLDNDFVSAYSNVINDSHYYKQHYGWFYKQEQKLAEAITDDGFFDANEIGGGFVNRPHTHTFHSPDVIIEQGLALESGLDELQLINTVYSKTGNVVGYSDHGAHYYVKCKGDGTFSNPAQGRRSLGARTRIKTLNVIPNYQTTLEKYDTDELKLTFENWQNAIVEYPIGGYRTALGHDYTVLVRVKDLESVDVTVNGNKYAYHLANYLRPKMKVTESDTAAGIYEPTGHGIQITQDFLNKCEVIRDEYGNITHYVINGSHVWGGNTYVNYWDITRLVGWWSNGCRKRSVGGPDYYPDYSLSHIIPIESKYNLAMMLGRSFAKDATKPQSTGCGNFEPELSNGIMSKQPADYSYNKVLNTKEIVRNFARLPADAFYAERLPSGIIYSEAAIPTATKDYLRSFLPLSAYLYEQKYGAITALHVISGRMYALQESALAYIPTTEREVLLTQDQKAVTIGGGQALDKANYISTDYGCQHKLGSVATQGRIFFIDGKNKKFLQFSQAGLDRVSDNYRQHDALLEINDAIISEAQSIVLGHSLVSNQIYISFHTAPDNYLTGKTLVYDIDVTRFARWEAHAAPMLLTQGGKLISNNPDNLGQLWTEGTGPRGWFFGKEKPSIIEFVIADRADYEKVFDNQQLNLLNHLSLVKAEFTTVKSKHTLFPDTDFRATYRNSHLSYPMFAFDQKGRLQGTYLRVRLTFANPKDRDDWVLTFARTTYRISHKV